MLKAGLDVNKGSQLSLWKGWKAFTSRVSRDHWEEPEEWRKQQGWRKVLQRLKRVFAALKC